MTAWKTVCEKTWTSLVLKLFLIFLSTPPLPQKTTFLKHVATWVVTVLRGLHSFKLTRNSYKLARKVLLRYEHLKDHLKSLKAAATDIRYFVRKNLHWNLIHMNYFDEKINFGLKWQVYHSFDSAIFKSKHGFSRRINKKWSNHILKKSILKNPWKIPCFYSNAELSNPAQSIDIFLMLLKLTSNFIFRKGLQWVEPQYIYKETPLL